MLLIFSFYFDKSLTSFDVMYFFSTVYLSVEICIWHTCKWMICRFFMSPHFVCLYGRVCVWKFALLLSYRLLYFDFQFCSSPVVVRVKCACSQHECEARCVQIIFAIANFIEEKSNFHINSVFNTVFFISFFISFLSLILFMWTRKKKIWRSLPVPWLLYGIFYGAPVRVSSCGMVCSIAILFMMLIFVIVSIACFQWRMNKGLGVTMFLLYFVFVAVSLMFEYGHLECPF